MFQINNELVIMNYENAKEVFATYGVDTEEVIKKFKTIPISVHNWQDDDVKGFEGMEGIHSENVVTGSYPGASRNGDEMRKDLEMAFRFSPCKHKINLHSMYAEPEIPTQRNELKTEDFRKWIDWAKLNKYGIDFNVSYFTHPMMDAGCSLASSNKDVRDYWIKAGIASRKISYDIGKELGDICVNNTWVPDGTKDIPANRSLYRQHLIDSLNQIFEVKYDRDYMCDVLEGKVFGIGTECFVVGSHDFYIGYAVKNGIGVTMDTGHYHPLENIADKISAVYPFVDYIMLHLSRGVRWDSDHCLIQSDELLSIMQEIKRQDLFDKNIGIGLDFFDATINRVSAWIIGLRATGKAMLSALLEPSHLLIEAEENGNLTERLALLEEFKNLPINAIWDYICYTSEACIGAEWLLEMRKYEQEEQLKRI